MIDKPDTADTVQAPKRMLNAAGERVLSIEVPPAFRGEPGARETIPSGLAPLSEVLSSIFGLRPALEALARRVRSRRETQPHVARGDSKPVHQP